MNTNVMWHLPHMSRYKIPGDQGMLYIAKLMWIIIGNLLYSPLFE